MKTAADERAFLEVQLRLNRAVDELIEKAKRGRRPATEAVREMLDLTRQAIAAPGAMIRIRDESLQWRIVAVGECREEWAGCLLSRPQETLSASRSVRNATKSCAPPGVVRTTPTAPLPSTSRTVAGAGPSFS